MGVVLQRSEDAGLVLAPEGLRRGSGLTLACRTYALVARAVRRSPAQADGRPERARKAAGRSYEAAAQGMCLYAKKLDRGRFIWPQAKEGVVSLTMAQMSMLLELIDWRATAWTATPDLVV